MIVVGEGECVGGWVTKIAFEKNQNNVFNFFGRDFRHPISFHLQF